MSARNRVLAATRDLAHVESYGSMPVVVYRPDEANSRHGNFLDASYAAIVRQPGWRGRLDKVHAQARSSLPLDERRWKELDSSTSSDALLMNIFCHPATRRSREVAALLGSRAGQAPVFGFRARVPLVSGAVDRTEVDMRLGDLLLEAKLTESDFQSRPLRYLESYRDFALVFDSGALPRAGERVLGYQLIRNVLAAHALGCDFCVLLDERRPDLLEAWYAVMSCVRPAELRPRCKVFTWQELCGALSRSLQQFLDCKYGISPPGRAASAVPGQPMPA